MLTPFGKPENVLRYEARKGNDPDVLSLLGSPELKDERFGKALKWDRCSRKIFGGTAANEMSRRKALLL